MGVTPLLLKISLRLIIIGNCLFWSVHAHATSRNKHGTSNKCSASHLQHGGSCVRFHIVIPAEKERCGAKGCYKNPQRVPGSGEAREEARGWRKAESKMSMRARPTRALGF